MKTYKENGITIKPFVYDSCSAWTDFTRGKAALIINECDGTIDIDWISGAAPMAIDVILFALSDKDIRRMVKAYQQDGEHRDPFAVRTIDRYSGCEDIYINFYTSYGLRKKGKKLLHISQYGKLNEGFKEMKTGEFVEVAAAIIRDSGVDYPLNTYKKLRKISGCKYCVGYFDNNPSRDASKII